MTHDLGAVAQLGERDVRNVEVRGSIPLGSTITWRHLRIPQTQVPENMLAMTSNSAIHHRPRRHRIIPAGQRPTGRCATAVGVS